MKINKIAGLFFLVGSLGVAGCGEEATTDGFDDDHGDGISEFEEVVLLFNGDSPEYYCLPGNGDERCTAYLNSDVQTSTYSTETSVDYVEGNDLISMSVSDIRALIPADHALQVYGWNPIGSDPGTGFLVEYRLDGEDDDAWQSLAPQAVLCDGSGFRFFGDLNIYSALGRANGFSHCLTTKEGWFGEAMSVTKEAEKIQFDAVGNSPMVEYRFSFFPLVSKGEFLTGAYSHRFQLL